MENSLEWEGSNGLYRLGGAVARKFDEPLAFVILSFGAGADADTAFGCIAAAMRFGLMAIHGNPVKTLL